MGKLRQLIQKIIKYKPQQNALKSICTHKILPQKQHFTNLVVHADDYCKTCQQKICLVCSQVHIQQHCVVKINVVKQIGQGKLKQFNEGNMMYLPLNQEIKCICGKPLGHQPDHAICSACGMASCSIQCHKKWQQMGNCTYHENYYQKPEQINMRSILFRNIKNIQKSKISQWNLASKNALSYIACYAKTGVNYVYLQRGYRRYGKPQDSLLNLMKKMQFGLDFTTHLQRVCTCQCQICQDRGIHSVGNCEHSCVQKMHFNSFQFRQDADMHTQCGCDCNFCRSGIVVNRHTKMDCVQHCYKSSYNMLQME